MIVHGACFLSLHHGSRNFRGHTLKQELARGACLQNSHHFYSGYFQSSSVDFSQDFPPDPTGRFDEFKNFVKSNFKICKWIGLTIVGAQVLKNYKMQ